MRMKSKSWISSQYFGMLVLELILDASLIIAVLGFFVLVLINVSVIIFFILVSIVLLLVASVAVYIWKKRFPK